MSTRRRGSLLLQPTSGGRGGRELTSCTQPVLEALLALLLLTRCPRGQSLQSLHKAGGAEARKAAPACPEWGLAPEHRSTPFCGLTNTPASTELTPACLGGLWPWETCLSMASPARLCSWVGVQHGWEAHEASEPEKRESAVLGPLGGGMSKEWAAA